MRFGWALDDAVEHHETTVTTTYEGQVVGDTLYINERNDEKTKIRMHLEFHRDKNKFANLGAVTVLEVFYNIFFYLRRIIGFFLPILGIATILVAALLQDTELFEKFGMSLLIGFLVWILLIILEGVFARIAGKILRYK